jgi:hypothetical protein
MAELQDLRLNLNRPDVPSDSPGDETFSDTFDTEYSTGVAVEPPSRVKWSVLALMLVVAAAIGYFVYTRPSPAAPQTAVVPQAHPAVVAPAQPKEGPLVEAEQIDLPPLPQMDGVVRGLMAKLSSHPKVMAWLATKGLIENFTLATLTISEGRTPVRYWAGLRPNGRFSVTKTSGGMRLDPRSYRRYDEFAAAIEGLDPAGTARLYLTLKPRIMEAYRNLGYPDGDFDPVLEHAMAVLLTTNEISGDIALTEKTLAYGYADPRAEALPSAQKQLLRMGPDNMRVVQQKLHEIAVQLGLHPESVR